MLNPVRHFRRLCNHFLSHGDYCFGVSNWNRTLYFSNEKCDLRGAKSIHTHGPLNGGEESRSRSRIRAYKESSLETEAGTPSPVIFRRKDIFPDEDLPTKLFNGVMYKDLPIVNIKVSLNNTIINLTEANGKTKLIRSCGMEGFQNVKKGTNLAAQATAITFGRKAVDIGYRTVRVRIQGLGPGRASSVRGLTMGGMDIVSVTDNTHVSDNPPRAKKQRRI